jgi:hypothetical protein
MLKPEDATPSSSEPPETTYEPPRVVWEEPFQTTVFGMSCAKAQGDPTCFNVFS